MSERTGKISVAVLILGLGMLLLIWGFIENAEGAKDLLYSFSFVFFIIAVGLLIYLFMWPSNEAYDNY